MKLIISFLLFAFSTTLVFASDDMITFKRGLDNDLYKIINTNNSEGVKKLIAAGADVNAVDRYRVTTPLIAASAKGFINIVKILIDNGANVNKYVTLGLTPLMSASGNGHLDVVRLLVEKGAKPDFAIKYKETALMHASLKGHLPVVKYLIKRGADPNLQNVEGVTALMFAVQNRKNFEVVKYLVEHGADLNKNSNRGGTALSWAGRDDEISDFLKNRGAK